MGNTKGRGGAYYVNHILLQDPCVFCGEFTPRRKKAKGDHYATMEHIVPKSAAGQNHWMNLAGACSTCNWQKSNFSLLEFLLGGSTRQIDSRQLTNHYDSDILPRDWYDPLGVNREDSREAVS